MTELYKNRGNGPFQLFGICQQEFIPLVKEELQELGAIEIQATQGGLSFKVPHLTQLYILLLKTQLLERLLLPLKCFSAQSDPMVFDQVSRLPFPQWISSQTSLQLQLEGTAILPGSLFKKIQEGIRKSFELKNLTCPSFDKNAPAKLVCFYHQKKLTVSFDLSGRPLHKRGHRQEGHPAPLRETLAAALLRWAHYRGERPLLDPFCGSGTLVVEGVTIALQKAIHIHRPKGLFGIEHLKIFDGALWKKVQDKLRDEKILQLPCYVGASDSEAHYVQLAKKIALKARVEKFIHFQQRDFFQMQQKDIPENALIVGNLPFGERIMAGEQLEDFYRQIGDHLKQHFQGRKVVFLVNKNSPWKKIGLHPSRKLNFKNGTLENMLLEFDIFVGQRKDYLQSQALKAQ